MPGSIARIVSRSMRNHADVQMFFAGLLVDVKAHDARLAGEAEPLFHAVESFHPLLVRKPLAWRKPDLAVKERLRAAGVRLGDQLHRGEGRHRVAAECFQAARLDQLGAISPFSPVIRYRASFAPSARILPFAIMAQRRQDRRDRGGELPRAVPRSRAASSRSSIRQPPAARSRAISASCSARGPSGSWLLPTRLNSTSACVKAATSTVTARRLNARRGAAFVAKPAARQITGNAHPGGGGFDLQTLAVCRMHPHADCLRCAAGSRCRS